MAEVNGVGKKVAIGAGIATGAAAVGAAIYGAKTGKIKFTEIKDAFIKGDKVGDEAKLMKRVGNTFKKIGDSLKDTFTGIWESISSNFGKAKKVAQETSKELPPKVGDAVQ